MNLYSFFLPGNHRNYIFLEELFKLTERVEVFGLEILVHLADVDESLLQRDDRKVPIRNCQLGKPLGKVYAELEDNLNLMGRDVRQVAQNFRQRLQVIRYGFEILFRVLA